MPDEVAGGVKDTTPPAPAAPKPQPPVTRSDASNSGGQTGTPGANNQGGQQPVKPAPGTNAGGNTGAAHQHGRRGQHRRRGQHGLDSCCPGCSGGFGAHYSTGPPPVGRGASQFDAAHRYVSSAVRPEFRNVLIGTVLTSASREPEEGVRISVRNANGGRPRATTTNAFGRFAVRLTDGDWAVDVTMPSGNVYEVSQIRVSDGVITDSLGRRVPSLEITR